MKRYDTVEVDLPWLNNVKSFSLRSQNTFLGILRADTPAVYPEYQ